MRDHINWSYSERVRIGFVLSAYIVHYTRRRYSDNKLQFDESFNIGLTTFLSFINKGLSQM